MTEPGLRATYIGGPTALFELGGLRLLTDPTFDAAGAELVTPAYTLTKSRGPALPAERLGPIDAVLLSHDHHFDNLDGAGRKVLASAGRVITTVAGAGRLGGSAVGLEPWQKLDLPAPDGGVVRVTATPARHGPAHADRGPVIGFHLARPERPRRGLYLSGDTVWYEGVAEVARRLPVEVAVLYVGAAQVAAVGPFPLTFTAEEAVAAARVFADATIVPLHFEGWRHFTESRAEIDTAFALAGLAHRLRWLAPGAPTGLAPGDPPPGAGALRLETDRLRLRRLTLDDAPFILELVNTAGFLRFVGDRGVRTLEDARRYLAERYLASYERHGFGLYRVELRSEGTPVGICGLLRRAELDDVDLGFALLPDFERRGYAGEAAAAVLGEGRDVHGLARIVAITDPDNAGSIRVLGRLGFRFERRVGLDGEELLLFGREIGDGGGGV